MLRTRKLIQKLKTTLETRKNIEILTLCNVIVESHEKKKKERNRPIFCQILTKNHFFKDLAFSEKHSAIFKVTS